MGEVHLKSREGRNMNNKPYISKETLNKIRTRKMINRRKRMETDVETKKKLEEEYKKVIKKQIQEDVENDIRRYEEKLVGEIKVDKNRNMWKIINQLTKEKKSRNLIQIKDVDERVMGKNEANEKVFEFWENLYKGECLEHGLLDTSGLETCFQ